LNNKQFVKRFVNDNDFVLAFKIIEKLRKKKILKDYDYVVISKMLYLAKAHYDLIVKPKNSEYKPNQKVKLRLEKIDS